MNDSVLFWVITTLVIGYMVYPTVWIYFMYSFAMRPAPAFIAGTDKDHSTDFMFGAWFGMFKLSVALLITPAMISMFSQGGFTEWSSTDGTVLNIAGYIYGIFVFAVYFWGFFAPSNEFEKLKKKGALDRFEKEDTSKWVLLLFKGIGGNWIILLAPLATVAVTICALHAVIF